MKDFQKNLILYEIKVPHTVLKVNGQSIGSFMEKRGYMYYYLNTGFYLLKKELINSIPDNQYLDATAFLKELINESKQVFYFPVLGYWLYTGRHEIIKKAKRFNI